MMASQIKGSRTCKYSRTYTERHNRIPTYINTNPFLKLLKQTKEQIK
jgi:hypothetical protein